MDRALKLARRHGSRLVSPVAAVLAVLVLAACAPGARMLSAPTFSLDASRSGFVRIDPPGIGEGTASFRIALRVENPNPFALKLAALDGDLFFQDVRAAALSFRGGIDLPAAGSAPLILDVRVPLGAAPALLDTIAGLVAALARKTADLGLTGYGARAAAIANSIAEQYIVVQTEAKRDDIVAASELLSVRVADLENRYNIAEEAVRMAQLELAMAAEYGSAMIGPQLEVLNSTLTNTRLERTALENRHQMVGDSPAILGVLDQVRERGHRSAERLVDVDLARGVVDVVVAAHHVGDAHVDVVHHHREVVGRMAVRAEDHQVVQLAVGDLDQALDLVVPHHRAVQRVLQPDHPVGVVAARFVQLRLAAALAPGAVVARLLALLHRRRAHGIQFFPGLVGAVGLAGCEQVVGHFAIPLQPVGLVERALVIIQAQPVHRLQDRVDRGLGAALAVGVLDPQHELPAVAACGQPAVQRGAGAADMQVAGGAGGKTGADGHGDGGSGEQPPILRQPAAAVYHGAMTTLFIADLHLDPERPAMTRLFGDFLDSEARKADALYILGDLFESWVGDDDPSEAGAFVAETLATLAAAGMPVFFMHGNRDFMLGRDYAARAGMRILPDPSVIELYDRPVLLMHGDLLCTGDVEYQKIRAQVRSPQWREQMLSQPLQARLAFAQQARAASQARQGEMKNAGTMETITDAAPATVEQTLRRFGIDTLIHGHTHRPAIHDLQIDGRPHRRIVLGDWYEQGSVLRAHPDGRFDLSNL